MKNPAVNRNPVAKHSRKFNKAVTHADRKKEARKNGPPVECNCDADLRPDGLYQLRLPFQATEVPKGTVREEDLMHAIKSHGTTD